MLSERVQQALMAAACQAVRTSIDAGKAAAAEGADVETISREAATAALFHFLCVIDGVGDPPGFDGPWVGLRLSEPTSDEDEPFLHDALMDALAEDARKESGVGAATAADPPTLSEVPANWSDPEQASQRASELIVDYERECLRYRDSSVPAGVGKRELARQRMKAVVEDLFALGAPAATALRDAALASGNPWFVYWAGADLLRAKDASGRELLGTLVGAMGEVGFVAEQTLLHVR